MRVRSTRVLSEAEQAQLWQDLEQRKAPDGEDALLRGLEATIGDALSPFAREGEQFEIDHYRPPAFVCRFTLLDKQLHRWEVVAAVVEAFDRFDPIWVLDLGLVDTVRNERGHIVDFADRARLIVTATEFLVDGGLGLDSIPTEITALIPPPGA